MKINKIYISAFGGLKDLTIELNDGMNVIFGENENGKSTVMAFIKMMFYGSGKKVQQISNSPRIKYTPFSGDTMGGRIDFEYGSHNYRLEREFKKSDSTDRIVLTDTDTGENLPATSDVGYEFFGIGANAFERCMFISGFGTITSDEGASGELNSKLSNLVVTGNEDVSYQSVVKRLDSAKTRLISKSGRTGKLIEDANILSSLKEKLELSHENAIKKREINLKLEELKNEYKTVLSEQKQIKSVVESENDIKNAKKIKEYLDTKNQLDKLNGELTLKSGAVLDEQFVKKTEFCINNTKRYSERCNTLNADIEKIKSAIELQGSPEETAQKIELLKSNTDNLIKDRNSLETKEEETKNRLNEAQIAKTTAQNSKSAFNPVLLIIGAVLLLSGVILTAVVNTVIGICVTISGVTFLSLSFVIRPADNSKIAKAQNDCINIADELASIKNEKATLQEKINALNTDMNTLLSVLNSTAEIKKQRELDLAEKTGELNEQEQKYNTANEELIKLFSDYSDKTDIEEIEDVLPSLTQKAETQKELKQKLMYLSRDLDNISYDEAKEKLAGLDQNCVLDDTDFADNKRKLDEINERLTQITSAITEKQTELKTSFRNAQNPEDIKKEINELSQKIKTGKAFCDACDIATEILSDSFAEIRRGYGSELENKTLEIFSNLTDGRYSAINISKSLDITVEQSGIFGTRELDYLSNGTADQAYLSLRLALSSLISEKEDMPVFLDDALSQYDDTRANRAIKFLKEYSNNSQTVMFTCHNAICSMAESNGITVKSLKP